MKGYIQVYTGNGKGKTTAALGLALRASGAGLKVYIAQFIKMGEYSEIKALERFKDLITVEQFGKGRFIKDAPSDSDIEAARAGIKKVKQILSS
ncbi:MAG: cob(I)yrinic acid a,c-diamide adenosyltransferase, partial [Desulfobacterales bacterium]